VEGGVAGGAEEVRVRGAGAHGVEEHHLEVLEQVRHHESPHGLVGAEAMAEHDHLLAVPRGPHIVRLKQRGHLRHGSRPLPPSLSLSQTATCNPHQTSPCSATNQDPQPRHHKNIFRAKQSGPCQVTTIDAPENRHRMSEIVSLQ
jgi:hypothetical protein